MKGLGILTVVALISALSFLPSNGWAMTCCQPQEASQGTCGDHTDHAAACPRHVGTNGPHEATDKVFTEYFSIQSQLANDSIEGISARATALAEAAEEYDHGSVGAAHSESESHMHEIVNGIGADARSLADAKDLEFARTEFGRMSEKMVELHKMYGEEHSPAAHAFVCDMAKKVWLQEDEQPRNPYYGTAMLRCARTLE